MKVLVKVSRDRLRRAMKGKGMTPAVLCIAAWVSPEEFRQIMEEGTCGAASLERISRSLGMDVTQIMDLVTQ